MISFVCATNDDEVLNDNLLASEVVKRNEVILQRGYKNIPQAYNEAKPKGELVVYIHQDVWLPPDWKIPEMKDWDVLGVAGVIKNGEYKDRIKKGWVRDRGKDWGSPEGLPARVDTLDELLLITKGDIKFDENLKFHFYGADICLGRRAYAINAYCHHNSKNFNLWENKEFNKSAKYMVKKHGEFITTCGQFK